LVLGDGDARFDLAEGGIIGGILMSGARGRPLKFFEVFLYIFNYYFGEFGGAGRDCAYCRCE
jgi:hypothetical protein